MPFIKAVDGDEAASAVEQALIYIALRQAFGGGVACAVLERHLLCERGNQRPIHQVAFVASVGINNREDIATVGADVVRGREFRQVVDEIPTDLNFTELE